MRKPILYCILLLLSSCYNATDKQQKNTLKYFDIKDYFDKEVLRLSKTNPLITKTVQVNDAAETRQIKIKDWKRELAVFSEADINRASWKGLFQVSDSGNSKVFTSDNEKVPVKAVSVTYKNNRIFQIKALVKNSNSLYTTVDTLIYYPDSLYRVKKAQNIWLLSKKNYVITGKFK